MPDQTQKARDRIRGRFLGSHSTRNSKIVEIDGEKVLIKAPSIAAQDRLNDASGFELVPSPDGDPKKATARIKHPMVGAVAAVMECCFDPESGERLFDEADRESLLNDEGMGGWLLRLSTEVQSVIGLKPAEAAKNSEATAPAAT